MSQELIWKEKKVYIWLCKIPENMTRLTIFVKNFKLISFATFILPDSRPNLISVIVVQTTQTISSLKKRAAI